MRSGIIFALTWMSSVLLANEGALPRGKDSGPGVKYKINKYVDPDGNCYEYLINPDPGYVAFNPFSRLAYFVGKGTGVGGKGERSFILELNLGTRRIQKLSHLKVVDNASLVAHQDPTTAVTLLDFNKGEFGCGQGESSGFGVQWGERKGVAKTFARKRYKILRASSGQQLLDRVDGAVRRFDLKVMQRRTIVTLPQEGVPLYADLNKNQSFHFIDKPQRSLVKFDVQTRKKLAEIRLAPDMKLIQADAGFAIATIDSAANAILVSTFQSWSGVPNQRWTYPIKGLAADKAKLTVEFETGIGLVSGRNKLVSQKLRTIDVLDGNKKERQIVRQIKLEKNQYAAIVEVFPFTQDILIITKEINTDHLRSVSIYNVKSDKLDLVRIER